MLSKMALLVDPSALVVVFAGTLLATLARCGLDDLKVAARAVARLPFTGFDADANRPALARAATAIHERGHLCAETPEPPDGACAKLIDTVIQTGTTEALRIMARAQRTHREVARIEAQRVFECAGELAPVFGLVGTLFAISQLVPDAAQSAAATTMASVATAVLSSLYGVLSAHLVYLPLARAIERHGEREEQARKALIDWFEDELAGEHAHRHLHHRGAA